MHMPSESVYMHSKIRRSSAFAFRELRITEFFHLGGCDRCHRGAGAGFAQEIHEPVYYRFVPFHGAASTTDRLLSFQPLKKEIPRADDVQTFAGSAFKQVAHPL